MKKLAVLLLIVACLIAGTAMADDPKDLENGPVFRHTIFTNLEHSNMMNLKGTYGEIANVQLRIPEDDWKAGDGRAAGEPVWTITRTEGPEVELTPEAESWNDHRGEIFWGPETITASGTAKYDITCTWNGQDYAAKAELTFTTLDGELPSGLALTVAPYDWERKTAGAAVDVTNDTFTVETGKYFIVSAAFADNPIERTGITFTLNHIINNPKGAEFYDRFGSDFSAGQVQSNQQVFKAGTTGDYTLELSLNSNEGNIAVHTPFTLKVTEEGDNPTPTPEPTEEPTAAPEDEETPESTATPEPTATPVPVIPVGQSGWVQTADGGWTYGDKNGNALLGSQVIDGVRYCFDDNGRMITGWGQANGKWYYADQYGSIVTGWREISKVWYYFEADGKMRTGWLNDGGIYYYFRSSGAMATGWVEDGGAWYYMDRKSGALVSNWQQIDGKWYYFKPDGSMATGWTSIGGDWYYFKSNGEMIANDWFRDVDAEAQSGSGRQLWYWFDKNGIMAKDWKQIDGKWEYFSTGGLWQYSWSGN